MTQLLQPSPPATLAETLSVIDAVLASLAPRLPPHVSLEDLASAGKLALVEAMLRFDGPVCEARAYCYVRVRGAVLDELRRLDPLSRQARARVRLVRVTIQGLERLLGRAPNECEVATAAGLSITQLRHIELLANAAGHCFVAGSGADSSDGCEIVDEDADTPAGSAESRDVAASVHEALARLPVNHARVLRRYYLEDATLDQIAAEMGISKERVRQIREAGEKRLRADFVVLALWQSFLNHI
jgi:RNA polymerase sigma factor for flagellar operon FliA